MLNVLLLGGAFLLAAAALWTTGRWHIVREMRDNEQAAADVLRYHNDLIDYANSRGENTQALRRVMGSSAKVERHLGRDNILYATRVFHTIYNGVPAIPMLINSIQSGIRDRLWIKDAVEAVDVISNLLLRHHGRRYDRTLHLHDRAKNPFLCITDGWKVVAALPVSFLGAFGLISQRQSVATQGSFLFRLYSAVLFLAAVASPLIAYVADREKVDAVVKSLL